MSPRLLAQYPEEMTIILQHQFWDLAVSEDCFEVGLAFGGVPERLVVPFNAIKSFTDPSAPFGLQFETAETEVPAAAAAPSIPDSPNPPDKLPAPSAPPATADTEDKPRSGEGAEVVRLDRFRKK
jgi:hypothetical protein